ncbi:hypothetical protein GCM10027073_14410 [Streptomyces chlorus]|uniref:Uncharacterized protein n=1 Tax=Streptomyces chlorus TaxID=887452 RepID=A0ABW1DS50_9ACTN
MLPDPSKGTEAAVAAHGKKGVEFTASTRPVADRKDFPTFSSPITHRAADMCASQIGLVPSQ